MGLKNKLKSVAGVVNVQVEGFFTERFINLCKINNINIWDIKNIVTGVIRFNISISDFKKLRKIARKTKCKVSIKNKKGIYFWAFKYRKRKIFLIFAILAISLVCLFSSFIWDIKVLGNEIVDTDIIVEQLRESGFKIGTFKIGLDKSSIITDVRAKNFDITWMGIDISGTTAYVKVIEKTRIDEKNIQETKNGDIIAKKSGVITKIIAENGTACVNEGSFVEEGMKLIEGKIYSQIVDIRNVPAKGIVLADVEYNNEIEYYFEKIDKVFTNKKRWTIGITIDSKEYMINYLNKSLKYDKIKKSKSIKLFGKQISFDLYSFEEYIENITCLTQEQILEQADKDSNEYANINILPYTNEGKLVSSSKDIISDDEKIVVKSTYIVNEKIEQFKENYE